LATEILSRLGCNLQQSQRFAPDSKSPAAKASESVFFLSDISIDSSVQYLFTNFNFKTTKSFTFSQDCHEFISFKYQNLNSATNSECDLAEFWQMHARSGINECRITVRRLRFLS